MNGRMTDPALRRVTRLVGLLNLGYFGIEFAVKPEAAERHPSHAQLLAIRSVLGPKNICLWAREISLIGPTVSMVSPGCRTPGFWASRQHQSLEQLGAGMSGMWPVRAICTLPGRALLSAPSPAAHSLRLGPLAHFVIQHFTSPTFLPKRPKMRTAIRLSGLYDAPARDANSQYWDRPKEKNSKRNGN